MTSQATKHEVCISTHERISMKMSVNIMNKISNSAAVLLALAALTLSSSAQATDYLLQTSDKELIANNANQGWWNSANGQTTANGNYITGVLAGTEYRSFYTFNLGVIPTTETILSADVYIYNGVGGFAGTGGNFQMWGTTSAWQDINTNNGALPNYAAVFADLAGPLDPLGSTVYPPNPASGGMTAHSLNSAGALANLQAKVGGMWTMGATYAPTGGTGNLFGFTSGTFRTTLVIKTDGVGGGGGAGLEPKHEEALCTIINLLLIPQGQRSVDGELCGPGDFNSGLVTPP